MSSRTMLRRVACGIAVLFGAVLSLFVALAVLLSVTGNGAVGDPGIAYHLVVLHNASDVTLLVSDDPPYSPSFVGMPLQAGETKEVNVKYGVFYRSQAGKDERNNEVCVLAQTEDSQVVFHRCPTVGQLEDAGWKPDIVKGPPIRLQPHP